MTLKESYKFLEKNLAYFSASAGVVAFGFVLANAFTLAPIAAIIICSVAIGITLVFAIDAVYKKTKRKKMRKEAAVMSRSPSFSPSPSLSSSPSPSPNLGSCPSPSFSPSPSPGLGLGSCPSPSPGRSPEPSPGRQEKSSQASSGRASQGRYLMAPGIFPPVITSSRSERYRDRQKTPDEKKPAVRYSSSKPSQHFLRRVFERILWMFTEGFRVIQRFFTPESESSAKKQSDQSAYLATATSKNASSDHKSISRRLDPDLLVHVSVVEKSRDSENKGVNVAIVIVPYPGKKKANRFWISDPRSTTQNQATSASVPVRGRSFSI